MGPLRRDLRLRRGRPVVQPGEPDLNDGSGRPLRLLGLSGSLRAASTNTALLRAAGKAAPPWIAFVVFDDLGGLPIFNPDLDASTPPPAVAALRREVLRADGLVIACPEYAHGIPGGLKNALDWLVSGSEIPGKPIALFHASTRSRHGRAALVEVLETMSTRIVTEIAIPLLGLSLDAVVRRLADADVAIGLERAWLDIARYISAPPTAPEGRTPSSPRER